MKGHTVLSKLIRISSPLLLLLVLFSVAGLAQEAAEKLKQPEASGIVAAARRSVEHDPAAWKEYKSDAGRFSILFPGTPQEETGQVKSGEQEVAARIVKLSGIADYAVIYVDSPMSHDMNPRATRDMFDSTVKRATETFQAASLERKEIVLDGYTGLFVKLRLADRAIMRLKMYVVRGRVYQIMVTTPPEQGATGEERRFYEATAGKFLNSFTLAPLPPLPPVVIAGGRAPITGGILNDKAISKPSPLYPAAAKAAGVTGTVEVAVTIDEEGRVTAAKAISGAIELREAAVEAALKARFPATRLSGKPVKISGRLSYKFSLD